ncbi:MAG: choice-of-anchor M domain-containing protein [Opitutaceae bacterium]|jgi:surface-anchored protein|nr:choice-of-anchor M domain-containing protein [Opitutaceae bacterium]
MITPHRLPLLAAASLALATQAFAQIELPADHADLGIGFHDNELELHWHLEDLELEYKPHEAYVFIPLSSSILRPAGAAWDFTGAIAGGTIYLAPELDQTPNVIFLGLGSEEIANGTFAANTLTFALTGIVGDGEFSLWQTNGLGQPTAFLSSATGSTSFDLITGRHEHFNWGFTAPGIYALTFSVSGILDDGQATPVSDTATFTFAVGTTPIPEPSAFAALAGLAVLGFVGSRRRR